MGSGLFVMLACNLWRWMKMLAGCAEQQRQQGRLVPEPMCIRKPDRCCFLLGC